MRKHCDIFITMYATLKTLLVSVNWLTSILMEHQECVFGLFHCRSDCWVDDLNLIQYFKTGKGHKIGLVGMALTSRELTDKDLSYIVFWFPGYYQWDKQAYNFFSLVIFTIFLELSALCRPTLFLRHFMAPMLQKECNSDCANNERTDKIINGKKNYAQKLLVSVLQI